MVEGIIRYILEGLNTCSFGSTVEDIGMGQRQLNGTVAHCTCSTWKFVPFCNDFWEGKICNHIPMLDRSYMHKFIVCLTFPDSHILEI